MKNSVVITLHQIGIGYNKVGGFSHFNASFTSFFKPQIKFRKLLLKMNICFSKEEAGDLILLGDVFANGILQPDPNAKILSGDVVKVDGNKIRVE